MKFGIYWC